MIKGDSLNDPAYPYQMSQPLIEEVAAFYNPKAGLPAEGTGRLPSAGFNSPMWVNLALAGYTIDQINFTIAAQLALYKPTHVILAMGTVEVSTTRAETQAALASLVGKFTNGEQVLCIGPYGYGEKYPSGQNTGTGASNDQRLDETNVDIPAIFCAAYANSIYVDMRNTLYATVMPPLNQPPPGQYVGPFTVDGVHWAPRGRAAAYSIWRPYVSFG